MQRRLIRTPGGLSVPSLSAYVEAEGSTSPPHTSTQIARHFLEEVDGRPAASALSVVHVASQPVSPNLAMLTTFMARVEEEAARERAKAEAAHRRCQALEAEVANLQSSLACVQGQLARTEATLQSLRSVETPSLRPPPGPSLVALLCQPLAHGVAPLERALAAFDVRQWCAENGFGALAGGLAWVVHKQDLATVTAEQLAALGATALQVEDFLRRAREAEGRREEEEVQFESAESRALALEEMEVLHRMLVLGVLSPEGFETRRRDVRSKYCRERRHDPASGDQGRDAGTTLPPQHRLVVHPPAPDVELSLYALGDKVPRAVATADRALDVSTLPDGAYDLMIFIRGATGSDVKVVAITVRAGLPHPAFVDTGWTWQPVRVRFDDQARAGIEVVVKTSTGEVRRTTDASGDARVTLEPGKHKVEVEHTGRKVEDDLEVVPREELTEPPQDPLGKATIVLKDCKKLFNHLDPIARGSKVAVLGDTSGSMSASNRMEVLRESFRAVYEEAVRVGAEARLYAWNNNVVEPPYKGRGDLEAWLSGLRAGGSTELLLSIRTALSDAEGGWKADVVYVLCDGEVSTTIHGQDIRGGRSDLAFNFVALGADCQFDNLKRIAEECGGNFAHAK